MLDSGGRKVDSCKINQLSSPPSQQSSSIAKLKKRPSAEKVNGDESFGLFLSSLHPGTKGRLGETKMELNTRLVNMRCWEEEKKLSPWREKRLSGFSIVCFMKKKSTNQPQHRQRLMVRTRRISAKYIWGISAKTNIILAKQNKTKSQPNQI